MDWKHWLNKTFDSHSNENSALRNQLGGKEKEKAAAEVTDDQKKGMEC